MNGQQPGRRPMNPNGRPAASNSSQPRGGRPAENGGQRRSAPKAKPSAAEERTRIQAALGSGNGGSGSEGGNSKKGRIKAGIVVKVVFLNLLKAFVVMCCLGLMVGCVVGVQVVQFIVETTENDDVVLDLNDLPLKQTSYFMALNPDIPEARDRRNEETDYIVHQELIGDENRIWVSGDEIPEYLKQAVIATEDKEFEDHHGVNFARSAFALVNEVISVRNQFGASTLDQQLVKNITGDDEVDYMRKIREMFRAWNLNNNYTKDQIMEAYLNTISLSERLAGVEAGANAYFDKHVSDLTLAECATIAGITRAPTYYSPFQNPENSRNRRNYVLGEMLKDGYISQAQHDEACALPLGLAPRRQAQTNTSQTTGSVFSYASDKVYNDVIADYMEKNNCTYSTAFKSLYNQGWKVYMTVDLRIQQAVDDIMVGGYEEGGYFVDETRFPGYMNALTQYDEKKDGAGNVIERIPVYPQAAVIVINYSGELLATSGSIGSKETSLSLNRGIGTVVPDANSDLGYKVEGSVRQVGSTMKPIAAYALGIDNGIITYSKMIKDKPVASSTPSNPRRDPETGSIIYDWPTNYAGKGGKGANIPVVSAIAESLNTVAVQVGMYVGKEEMFEFLRDTLEVTTLVEPNDVDWAPLTLGSMTYGMSLYELAGSFMMFGGNDTYGQFVSLHSYTKVTDSKGNIILEPEIMRYQAIDPQSGYVMNRLLANVLKNTTFPGGAVPTAGGMAPTHPDGVMDAVAKTGTTSDDKDRLFVGLTPYYVTAVWWGYDNPRDHGFLMNGRTIWSPGARYNIPVNVWKSLMETVQADLPIKEFPPRPDGVQELTFCTTSGDRASPGCPAMTGYYTNFKTPDFCSGHDDDEETPPEE